MADRDVDAPLKSTKVFIASYQYLDIFRIGYFCKRITRIVDPVKECTVPEPGSRSEGSKILSSAAIPIVDKAWEISWATRIIFIILAPDISFLVTGDDGLLSWAQGSEPNVNLAGALIFGALFCFVAAYVLPSATFLLKTLLPGILIQIPEKPDRHPDHVLDHRVLTQGIENDYQFMLDWYLYNREREISRDSKLRDLSYLLFGLLLIASVNFCFGYWHSDSPSALYGAAMKSCA